MAKRRREGCSTQMIRKRDANQNYNVVSAHTSQNGRHQQVYGRYMLEGVWREGSPPTLWVRIQIGTSSMEKGGASLGN